MSTYKQTVAIDLDGTLAQYDGWKGVDVIGAPRPGALEFVTRLVAHGFDVVVYTARVQDRKGENGHEPEDVVYLVHQWLGINGFPVEVRVHGSIGKPMAVAYVDDRSVKVPTNPGEGDFANAFLDVKILAEK